MYCHNCGRQLPDGVAFCSYCGAKQDVDERAAAQPQPAPRPQPAPQPQPAPRPAQQSAPRPAQSKPAAQAKQKPKRRWTRILVTFLAFFAAGLVIEFVVNPSEKTSSNNVQLPTVAPMQVDVEPVEVTAVEPVEVTAVEPVEVTAVESADGTEGAETNAAYSDIFFGKRVVHLPMIFGLDVQTARFAKADGEDNIACQDFGYRGDQVVTFIETHYYCAVSTYADGYVENLTTIAQQDAARYGDTACASVTYNYNEESDYFSIRYEFTNLDQPENCQALYDLGIITDPSGLSMALCEQTALADGYVKA